MAQSLIKSSSLRDMVQQPAIQTRLKEIMGERGQQFAVALVNIVRNSMSLQQCKPETVLGAAFQAAALDLSVDPNIGEAHLVPYKDACTLQIGYLGLAQLALRTGQYKSLGWAVVHEGELKEYDELTGELVLDKKSKVSDLVIGYAAKFKLLNGFERGEFWTAEEVEAHAKRFSQSYRNGRGPWKDAPERMALKTVLKRLLKLWGPKSIAMQKALRVDEAAVVGDGEDVVYPDASEPVVVRPDFGEKKPEALPQPKAVEVGQSDEPPPFDPDNEGQPAQNSSPVPLAPTPPPKPAAPARRQFPAAHNTTAPKPAPTPAPSPKPAPAKEESAFNPLKAARGLMAAAKLEEQTVMEFLNAIGASEATSLEQLALSEPENLQMLVDQWADISERIHKARSA